MMVVFALLIVAMMLLCVAAAAGLFPNEWSRRWLQKLLERKELAFLAQLREILHSEA